MSQLQADVYEGYGWRSFDLQVARAQFALDRVAAAADYDFSESVPALARRLQTVLGMLAHMRSDSCNAAYRLISDCGRDPETSPELATIRSSLADIVNAVNLKGSGSCETYRHRLDIIGNRISRIQDDLQLLESTKMHQRSA